MIKILQQQSKLSTRETSEALGLGYRQLLRWQERTRAGAPALVPPGPKKTGPLPLAAVRAEVEALQHHHHRSEGTVALYEKHQGVISRRELARLVAEERGKQEQDRRRLYRRIDWHVPNVAWAIDATERGRDKRGRKLFVHAVQDLCSRYRFAPLLALESKGPAVAEHLEKLFRRHGPPRFLKRDNGSPLNAAEVDTVLADYGVIPLNSPAYYPRYNGAIEKGIREMQEALGTCLIKRPVRWQPAALLPYVIAVQHDLNCKPRRVLHQHTACEVYHHQPHAHYTKRERLAIFEWIRIHAKDRIQQLEKIDQRSVRAAWRRAAETWLRCQGLITVSINQKVLPNLPLKYVHD
jgi:transposase InsO family protein